MPNEEYSAEEMAVMRAKARYLAIQQARLDRYLVRRIHALDFTCRCTRCTRLRLPTQEDRDFLKSMGIIWRKISRPAGFTE